MPYLILEAVERDLTKDLLRLSEIYDEYIEKSGTWVLFIKAMAQLTQDLLKDDNGNPVIYTPVQQVRDSLLFIIPTAEKLLTSIRRLKDSDTFEISDLYSRLDQLEIRKISQVDHKGLFLLAARAAENKGVFHE